MLAVAAAVSFRFDRAAPRAAAVPVYLGALFMLIVMATTVKAAPIMLGLAHLGEDTGALHRAFEEFTFWGVYVRGAALALAFMAAIWALVALYRHPTPAHTSPPMTVRS